MKDITTILLIGPPPYMDGGSRISFDFVHQYMRKIPNLVVHNFNLPVHHPLYNNNGSPNSTNHLRTIFRLLRAIILIPRVDNVIIFGSSDVCFSYGLIPIIFAKIFRKLTAIRIIGGTGEGMIFANKQLPTFARSICLVLARAIDMILMETKAGRDDLPARLQSKSIVITGFRPKPSTIQLLSPRPDDRLNFVFIGRAQPKETQPTKEEKGLDVLLDAADRIHTSSVQKKHGNLIKDIKFHIYGLVSPIMDERIQKMPNVITHGFMDNNKLYNTLGQYDVLVFPSRYRFEGHPGVVMEAFMMGLPVIASDLPGPSEIVHHEINGLIVKTGDTDSLAAAIIRLATDSVLCEMLAAGAQISASDFDQDKVIPKLIDSLLFRR